MTPAPTKRLRRRLSAGPRASVLLGVLAAALATLGCEAPTRAGGRGPTLTADRWQLETSVEMLPRNPVAGQQFSASFPYRVKPGQVSLGAYMAEVRFDPSLVELVTGDSAVMLERVANTGAASQGVVIVAGASPSGFTEELLFKATFRARVNGVTGANFKVAVREAADTQLQQVITSTAPAGLARPVPLPGD